MKKRRRRMGNEKEAELQSRDDQTLPEATEENLLNDDN